MAHSIEQQTMYLRVNDEEIVNRKDVINENLYVYKKNYNKVA